MHNCNRVAEALDSQAVPSVADILRMWAAFDQVDVAQNVWLRRGGVGRSLAIFLSGFMAILLGVVTLLGVAATIARPEKDLATMLALVGGFLCMAALFGYLTARLARAGLQITTTEVCLRGMARTYRMPLAEVDGFSPGVFRSLGTSQMGVRVRRKTGSKLDVWALGVGSAVTEAEQEHAFTMLQPICERLNRLLDEMRQATQGL